MCWGGAGLAPVWRLLQVSWAHDEGRGEGGIEIGGEEQLGDSLDLGWEKSEGGQGWAM